MHIRNFGNNYYADRSRSKWIKEEKRTRMLPPEYLGVVSRNSIVGENEITGIKGDYEYRNAAILHGIARETIIPVLKEIYPAMCERTISYVILRNIQPLPMKSLHYLYE